MVPRDLDVAPPTAPVARASALDLEAPAHEVLERQLTVPRVDDGGDPALGLVVSVSSKWCSTCRTYRPPRCSHCRSCDMCVDMLDHHCVFLNTCIGRRNYSSFIAFLCHALALVLVGLVGTAVKLYYLSSPHTRQQTHARGRETRGFVHALRVSPESAVFFFLGCVWGLPVACLWTYHLWLLAHNRSTVEQIRLESTGQLYDMQRVPNAWMHAAPLRCWAAVSLRVRNALVPPDFASPPPRDDANAPVPRRRRTPFQHRGAWRNALQVLGRAVPPARRASDP